jgi:hypothetical protein
VAAKSPWGPVHGRLADTAHWSEPQTRSTIPAAKSQSDQAVYAIGTIVPASFQPSFSKRPTDSSEPRTSKAPTRMPGQANQPSNDEDCSMAMAISSVQAPVNG